MPQVHADEHLRATLQDLKASGAFTRDASGQLRDLDPAIAADLIDGEKPALPLAAQLPGTNPLTIPRQKPPLAAIGSRGAAPGASGGEPKPRRGSRPASGAGRQTEELIGQITREIETFNKHVVENFEQAKGNMQHNLLALFDQTSREKLPDSFLKSLPKWGKNATKLHHIFSKSSNRKRTDSQADRREIPFDLVVQPEVLEEMKADITTVIDGELRLCCGESGIIVQDMQRIFRDVAVLMDSLRLCEKEKRALQVECSVLDQQLQEQNAENQELEARISSLHQEMREKDVEQDRLRDRILRQVEEQQTSRQRFTRECMMYQMQIWELKQESTRIAEQQSSPKHSAGVPRRDSFSATVYSPTQPPPPTSDLPFDAFTGGDGSDANLVEDTKARVTKECEEKLRKAVSVEREKGRDERSKLQIKLEEHASVAKNLNTEKLRLEAELVEKTRELRRLREQVGDGF
eukprot:TRINITY_DN25081_c0_g1_i1.p1 TRINITY_DN25081_c0_g1~~TRINITY_DN25081_c0_g1_i1.p1  ORF type:complete len:463 (+),score=198.47 TRINITY_DN25081_c0_g1_i1:89-1477(+)